MASTELAHRLQEALDQLTDPVSRRRWGRAIDYFLERLQRLKRETDEASIARDVLHMLLPGRQGLRANAPKLSQAATDAVTRLEDECRRIVREEPVNAFGIGLVDGGNSPQAPEFDVFWRQVREAEDGLGADFTLVPIYHLEGRFFHPKGSGIVSSRLYLADRSVVVDVDVPEHLGGRDLHAFLRGALEEARQRATVPIKRRKLAWSTTAQQRLLDRLPPLA